MEHSGQDPIGWGELGFGACTGSYQARMTTNRMECLLVL